MNPTLRPPTFEHVPGIWTRLVRGYRKLRSTEDWPTFAGADWPQRIMNEEVTDRFHAKQGRSIGRWTLTANLTSKLVVYLKRHYRLPRWNGLMSALFPGGSWSAGLQEWEHLQRAAALGIPVPRPVAAGELVGPFGKLQSFLAVEELTDMLPLHEAIPLAQTRLSPSLFARWKRSLAVEIARLARRFHDNSYFHKDLYLCHFYIHIDDIGRMPDDWQQRVVVIDLHRLGRHRLTAFWWKVKDLAQLLYSSEVAGVTARDRLTFWRAYRGKRCGRGLLARLIRQKWKLYRRHNDKKQ